jgi:hypothetical protein
MIYSMIMFLIVIVAPRISTGPEMIEYQLLTE